MGQSRAMRCNGRVLPAQLRYRGAGHNNAKCANAPKRGKRDVTALARLSSRIASFVARRIRGHTPGPGRTRQLCQKSWLPLHASQQQSHRGLSGAANLLFRQLGSDHAQDHADRRLVPLSGLCRECAAAEQRQLHPDQRQWQPASHHAQTRHDQSGHQLSFEFHRPDAFLLPLYPAAECLCRPGRAESACHRRHPPKARSGFAFGRIALHLALHG